MTGPEAGKSGRLRAEFGSLKPGPIARFAWWLATLRRASSRQRRFFRKRLAVRFPGPFDIEVEGIRIRAWPAENHSDRTMVGRLELPERRERSMIAPLLQPKMVFVDIGANIGLYSLLISAKTGAKAHIIALEPHPDTFAKLCFNRDVNGFANIAAYNLAAGSQSGREILYFDGGGNIGGASMLAEATQPRASIEIESRPLPDILREAGVDHVDLLKIDIEGFEDRALTPLFASAENRRLWPEAILLETVHRHLWQTDLLEMLERLGYSISGRTPENVLLKRNTRPSAVTETAAGNRAGTANYGAT